MVDVPFDVRLTIESGTVCSDWSEFHEWAEKIMGHPVWTHEFGSEDFNLDLKLALVMNDEGYHWWKDRESPIESLKEMMPDMHILCVVVEHEHLGHLCGYVEVPEGHQYHGKDYDEFDDEIDVHGGLTYADMGGSWMGVKDVGWLFGFDCAHSGDWFKLAMSFDDRSLKKWTVEEVELGVRSLARQLRSLEKAPPFWKRLWTKLWRRTDA